MRTLVVVKREIALQTVVGLIEGVIGFGIDLFIFDLKWTPQSRPQNGRFKIEAT